MKNRQAIVAVQEFQKHVKTVPSARSSKDKPPSSEDKACRKVLMEKVLDSLGLSKRELISILKIDKSTWDRWATIYSVPHPAHLNALESLAESSQSKQELVAEKDVQVSVESLKRVIQVSEALGSPLSIGTVNTLLSEVGSSVLISVEDISYLIKVSEGLKKPLSLQMVNELLLRRCDMQ